MKKMLKFLLFTLTPAARNLINIGVDLLLLSHKQLPELWIVNRGGKY